ncbi:MAG TPA: nitroreductase family protein [Opitutaceae bacterium]|nr:nitroreductase family protein [Opitutaceae bacterium]
MTTTITSQKHKKHASTDYPIHELLSERWSPYAFADRLVAEADLHSLFEAARWAASSYNEQPWTYFVATRATPVEFERLLSCLVLANQAWAKAAPVLVLCVVSTKFAKNRQDNRAAVHDLGLASANIVTEATARGLSVHQMIGILPEKARELYQIPQHFEAWTAMAIGYAEEADAITGDLRERDLAPRTRKPARAFVFEGSWGKTAALMSNGASKR